MLGPESRLKAPLQGTLGDTRGDVNMISYSLWFMQRHSILMEMDCSSHKTALGLHVGWIQKQSLYRLLLSFPISLSYL